MTTIESEARFSAGDLLEAVGQLDTPALERFVAAVIALQAHRKAPSLAPTEAELLQRINQGIPAELQRRYDALIGQRRAERLMPDEHRELLRLTEEIERIDAARIADLAALARLRGVSLAQLTADLELTPVATHG